MALNERKALATLLASFRRTGKFSNPIVYAESANYLVEKYGSAELVAHRLDVGTETIRALAKVAKMPANVKKLISDGKLLLTVAFDLLPFEPQRQVELAEEVKGLAFKDARAVIRCASRHPTESPSKLKQGVLSELEKRELNIVVVRVPRTIHEAIAKEGTEKTIVKLCNRWLRDGYPNLPIATRQSDLIRLIVKIPRQTYQELRHRTRKVANLVERIAIYYLALDKTC